MGGGIAAYLSQGWGGMDFMAVPKLFPREEGGLRLVSCLTDMASVGSDALCGVRASHI